MATFAASSGAVVSDTLLRQVNAWCGIHGLMYTDGDITWTPAPLALTPTPYPREAFEFVRSIQPLWNTLMDRIARDREFLLAELTAVSRADPFTQRVLQLFESLPEAAVRDTLQLAILRSDYMLDYYAAEGAAEGAAPQVRPLQVEINTISSSFGSLSHRAQRFHRDLLLRHGHHAQLQALLQQIDPSEAAQSAAAVAARHEDNASLPTIAAALAAAHDAYLEAHHAARLADRAALNRDVVVLFVVQRGERNVSAPPRRPPVARPVAHRRLSLTVAARRPARARAGALGRSRRARRVRHARRDRAAAGAAARGRRRYVCRSCVAPVSRALTPVASPCRCVSLCVAVCRVDGGGAPRLLLRRPEDAAPVEVSVAYYRAGYTPQDYGGEAEWAARRSVEVSAAVKCPSAGYHLAGAKAVQAALCKPGAVERFFPDDPQAAALLRRCFAAQFSLGDASVKPQAAAAIAAAIADRGARWVLKPQREGGGNNFYGDELARFLETHADDPALDGTCPNPPPLSPLSPVSPV
jgi:glutathione synthase